MTQSLTSLSGSMPAGGQPFAQQIMMHGRAEDVTDHQAAVGGTLPHDTVEIGGGIDAQVIKFAAEGDGVAAGTQAHDGDERFVEGIAAEVTGDGHAEEGVGGVDLAEGKFVADVRPADLAMEGNGEAFIGEEAAFLGGDDEGGVDQGHEANFQGDSHEDRVHSSACGRGVACGISLPSLCSIIALLLLLAMLIIQI